MDDDIEQAEEEMVEESRLKALQSEVDVVKDLMIDNVERIVARGERLDDLMGKTEDLEAGGQNFRQTVPRVNWSYWCKDMKLLLLIMLLLLLLILIILLAAGVIPTKSSAAPVPTPTPPPINPEEELRNAPRTPQIYNPLKHPSMLTISIKHHPLKCSFTLTVHTPL
ncbi:hypothetical protein GJAV_G00035230 [Gymnothorax javanicus]|nr:hypothetical protein GJAV_G00035230 [Gymnothorax javanicus]